jgi:hypothetical protein
MQRRRLRRRRPRGRTRDWVGWLLNDLTLRLRGVGLKYARRQMSLVSRGLFLEV